MSSETGTTGTEHDARSEKAKRDAEATKQKAASEAREGGRVVAEEAKAVAQQAGELGREHAERRFEQGKERIEGQVDAMSGALDDAAQRLRAENNPLASYADELSGQLSQLSRGIENSTLDDIAVKTRRIARENPGLFVLGSMVAGLAAARFFKASAEREHRDSYGDDGYAYGGDRYGERSFGDRDEYRRDGYRDGGHGTSSARGDDYRSPAAAGTAVPPRPDTSAGRASEGVSSGPVTGVASTGDKSGTGTAGASPTSTTAGTQASDEPSVSRVPMDSDTSIGTSATTGVTTPKTKTGA